MATSVLCGVRITVILILRPNILPRFIDYHKETNRDGQKEKDSEEKQEKAKFRA